MPSELHEDVMRCCGRCSWKTMRGFTCSSNGGNDYYCADCLLIWRQNVTGVLSSDAGEIRIPAGSGEDPFREA